MIKAIKIETFCHPTESLELVKKAFMTISPRDPDIKKGTTHFGLPILTLEAKLTKSKEIKTFLERMKDLPATDKKKLLAEAEERLENGEFHFSLDKFKALEGKVALADREPIRITIKLVTYPHNREAILAEVTSLLNEL